MNSRYSVLWITIAVLAISIAVDVLFPAYGTLVFYALLFWLIASFFFFRGPGVGRPTPGGGSVPTGSAGTPYAAGTPLPSGPPVTLGFCAFCGAGLPSGATQCLACKHAVRPF
jgi:hypothetical protein